MQPESKQSGTRNLQACSSRALCSPGSATEESCVSPPQQQRLNPASMPQQHSKTVRCPSLTILASSCRKMIVSSHTTPRSRSCRARQHTVSLGNPQPATLRPHEPFLFFRSPCDQAATPSHTSAGPTGKRAQHVWTRRRQVRARSLQLCKCHKQTQKGQLCLVSDALRNVPAACRTTRSVPRKGCKTDQCAHELQL